MERKELQTVVKPYTIRDLGPVDPGPILERLARLNDRVWALEDACKENKFFCFTQTRHIVHRFIPQNNDPRQSYETPAWMLWKDLLEPVMQVASAGYGYRDPRFPKAMFARLEAGGEIDRHKDGAGSNLVAHKIHVPLHTNPEAYFSVGDDEFHLEFGRAYEVNNIRSHAARNGGTEDRIHFIFELYEGAQQAVVQQ